MCNNVLFNNMKYRNFIEEDRFSTTISLKFIVLVLINTAINIHYVNKFSVQLYKFRRRRTC